MSRMKRFAVATAFLVTAGAASAQQVDLPGSGDEQVTLVADSLFEDSQNNSIIANGNVRARYQGRVLTADRVVYDRDTERVRATGNVVIVDEDGTKRFADELEVDSTLSDGYAIGFALQMPSGGKAVANTAIRKDGEINALEQLVYTACEVCEVDDRPTWALRARKAVLDEQSQMISYRDAILEIKGVPILYVPYFAHPDPTSERRSGLLPPQVGHSSAKGFVYQQPYYWAIGESQELTIAPEVYERVNPLMELEYSRRFWSGKLNINTSFTQERLFDDDGETLPESDNSLRSHVFADGLFSIAPNWQWGFGLERTSDDLYLERYDIDGERDVRGLYASQPKRLLSQLFLVGQTENFYSEAAVLNFQGLRAGDENSALPRVSPLMFAERTFDLGAWGTGALTGSSAIITREEGEDSRRVSLGLDLDNQRILPGGVVFKPFLQGRFDYFGLDEAESGKDNVTRGLATGGANLSYPFVRHGEAVDIVVEPILMGAWGVSNANDRAIPNEDSLLFEMDTTTLFDADPLKGYDLYEGDLRSAAGIRTTARWRNGVNLSTTAGRRWRSRSDPAFNEFSNLDGTSSDWLANVSADFGPALGFEAGMRFDDDDFALNRIDARMNTNIWRLKAAVQYFRIDEDIVPSGRGEEGILVQADFDLTERLQLTYNQTREIEDGFDTKLAVGLRYHDDCSSFELAVEQKDTRDREFGPSTNVTFRFTLRSLGNFGSRDVD